MELILVEMIAKYPVVMSIVVIVGSLRLLIKPVFEFLIKVADSTETQKDNELLQKVMNSKGYSVVVFLVDYLSSVKLPVKK